MHVRYAPGKTKRIAEFLSRPPCVNHQNNCQICNIHIDLPSKTEKDIREKLLDDPNLTTIINALEDVQNEEVNHRRFNRDYFLQEGVLYRHIDDQEEHDAKLVVPAEEVKNILNVTTSDCWFTLLYHAETNMVERKDRDLKFQLGILVGNQHNTKSQHLPTILFAINSARCDITGYSASYLTFGKEMRTQQNVSDDLSVILKNKNFVAKIIPKLQQLFTSLQYAKELTEVQTID